MAWYQYTAADGVIQASTSDQILDPASLDQLSAQNRAQIQGDDGLDPLAYKVDVTQTPPVIVPA